MSWTLSLLHHPFPYSYRENEPRARGRVSLPASAGRHLSPFQTRDYVTVLQHVTVYQPAPALVQRPARRDTNGESQNPHKHQNRFVFAWGGQFGKCACLSHAVGATRRVAQGGRRQFARVRFCRPLRRLRVGLRHICGFSYQSLS
jgi:hypothetical protein